MARILKTFDKRNKGRSRVILSSLFMSLIAGALFTASPSSAYKKNCK